jgi:hypothetical protein
MKPYLIIIYFFGYLLLNITFVWADDADRIQPFTQNHRFWQYHGKPLLLLGASTDDNLFQIPNLAAELDAMKSIGANYIRNSMSDSHDFGFEVYPFKRLENGLYDLMQWSEAYWQRFEDMLNLTAERDIIVQLEIWNRFDYSQKNWLDHPYNPANNVNYTPDTSRLANSYPDHPAKNRQPFFFTTPFQRNNTVVLEFQRRFVAKLLSYSLNFDNVLYCIDNETKAEEAWADYWSAYIKDKAREKGKTICITEMWDDWNLRARSHRRTLDHQQRYAFAEISQNNQNKGQQHWDNLQWVYRYIANLPRPLNSVKIYGADGGQYGTKRDGIERWWRNIIGGAASVRFHRPNAGLGLSESSISSIKSVRKAESFINFWEMKPANQQLADRERNEAYLSAKPGSAYVLYFSNGGAVGLDMVNEAGTFLLYWINIATSEVSMKPLEIVGGIINPISAPSKGHQLAIIVKKE